VGLASAAICDAKDDTAAAFYRHFGFASFSAASRTPFLPLATAFRAIEQLATRRP